MPRTDKPIIELIQSDHMLASVIDRFGIRFEHYRLPLIKACEHSNVDSDFVITIYKAFESGDFEASELQRFPLRSIIEYLIKNHLYYIKNKAPKLEKLMDALIANYGNSELGLFKLKDFFAEYKKNLFLHIQNEERNLFPYILKLLKASETEGTPYTLHTLLEQYSVENFTDAHDHTETALEEIGRRISNYANFNQHKAQVTLLLDELKEFENDLALHGRLEDEVLLPLARNLEESVKGKLLSLCVNN